MQSSSANKKPVVFLSHSSRNKKELAALKDLLDKRAAGSIDFFLSSDGQSITFGHNWIVSISDALADAKLMFVFLSAESVNSRWIHFEAGYAHSRGIQVVPVCLRGLSFEKVSEPLRLLQGFSLHSAGAMGNLARICNDVLKLKLPEEFSDADFKVIQRSRPGRDGFFGEFTDLISGVDCHANIPFAGDLQAAIEEFNRACIAHNADWCQLKLENATEVADFETHGAGLRIYLTHDLYGGNRQELLKMGAALGVELFESNAPVLETFGNALGVNEWSVSIRFKSFVHAPTGFDLTTKMYGTGIRVAGKEEFEFDGVHFSLTSLMGPNIRADKLTLRSTWLLTLVRKLFDAGVLFEAENETGDSAIDRLAKAIEKRPATAWAW